MVAGGLMLVVLRTGSKVHLSDNFTTVCVASGWG